MIDAKDLVKRCKGCQFFAKQQHLSHPILQGKPNASHMCARIIYTHMIDKTRVIPLL
jgi:hypothetical protein